jgi:hypothetical protein
LTAPTGDLVTVIILGLPVRLQREAAEHHDELFREFALLRSQDPDGHHTVPARLMALIDELTEHYSGFGVDADAAIDQALAEGRPTIDIEYRMPTTVRDACVRFGQLLAEADQFCRHGDLLTIAPPEKAVAFRNWFLEEFVRQCDGELPMSWDTYQRRMTSTN